MGRIYISENAYREVTDYISALGHSIVITKNDGRIGAHIGDHTDLTVCKTRLGAVFADEADLRNMQGKYPQNAAFCAVFLDNYLFHRLDITSKKILREAEKQSLSKINVRQGYTKCSCITVDGSAVITSDDGIYEKMKRLPDISVLKVSAGHVLLPGFDYGFIGGACGRVGDEIIFNGDISAHPDYDEICVFIQERGLKIKGFSHPLRDIGTIVEV